MQKLKAEIFDIIREQEKLQQAFNRLQAVKNGKPKQLRELEAKDEEKS